jgi:adenylate cyclase
MEALFHKRFDEEFLLSERLRTMILAGIFLFGVLYTGTVILFFEDKIPGALQKGSAVRMFFFLLFLFLLEVISSLYISRQIKRNRRKIPQVRQYLNATVEITAPGVIMILLAAHVQLTDKILHSPVVYLYFIFIMLSTLRLNYRISLYMGLLAAIEFFLISHLLIQKAEGVLSPDTVKDEYFATTGKAILLFFSGIGAAFVARQIRLNVERSLAVAEQGNRIVNLFGQQISKEIVNEMLESGGIVPTRMMRVCIMFIDIRNFTNYVADKTPIEIVSYQNAFFSIVVRVINKHNGIINQFLGDGCMATFGAPVVIGNPGLNAVQAALELRLEILEQVAQNNLPSTNIGIGLHFGSAVTGNIGPAERQQYSVTGTVVILAARIEQLNKEYQSQILASADVIHQINHLPMYNYDFLGKINLKGWSAPVGIYKLA